MLTMQDMQAVQCAVASSTAEELASTSLSIRVERWECEGRQQAQAARMPTSAPSKPVCGMVAVSRLLVRGRSSKRSGGMPRVAS